MATHELSDLFAQTVQLLRDRFDFKRVCIYTYNSSTGELTLEYGADAVGQRIMETESPEKLWASIVGLSVSSKQTLVVNDSSEMAVPLLREKQICGILYLQSGSPNFFNETVKSLLQVLAHQFAVVMVNIRLIAETKTALQLVENLNRSLTEQKWEQFLQHKQYLGYVYTPTKAEPTNSEWLPSMKMVLDHANGADDVAKHQADSTTDVAIPLKLRGEVVGVLGLERPAVRPWHEDEILAIQIVAEQISLALESARLFEETQRNAWRDQVISESTAKVWASTRIEEVMKAVVAQLGTKLRASEVVIQLDVKNEA